MATQKPLVACTHARNFLPDSCCLLGLLAFGENKTCTSTAVARTLAYMHVCFYTCTYTASIWSSVFQPRRVSTCCSYHLPQCSKAVQHQDCPKALARNLGRKNAKRSFLVCTRSPTWTLRVLPTELTTANNCTCCPHLGSLNRAVLATTDSEVQLLSRLLAPLALGLQAIRVYK